MPFSKRYALVKGLIQQQYESRSKWKTRVFLLVIYCVTLLGGMVGTLQAITPSWVRLLTNYSKNSQQILEQSRKNRQQQIEFTTAALRTNPNDVNAYIKRSRARLGLYDYKGALADYDQIVRLKPHDIESRMTRANFRNRLKDYKGEIQDYNEILRLNSKNVSGVYYQRAQVLNLLEDYKGAIADYNEIIKLNTKDTYTYISRGYTRQKLQDYKGAIADANYVIQLNPKEAEAYILRN
ncbi:tetratricopeptide repeat protein [Nostoc sp.]|uniref:tetratricopeptide repeat protein n=1 Tax=Nostoc sp. TaxID=1180 RepID=UPI002FF5D7B2